MSTECALHCLLYVVTMALAAVLCVQFDLDYLDGSSRFF